MTTWAQIRIVTACVLFACAVSLLTLQAAGIEIVEPVRYVPSQPQEVWV